MEKDKLQYFVLLYKNLLTHNIDHETFLNIFTFINDAAVYEIKYAINLSKRDYYDTDYSFSYIKRLDRYGLVNVRWGALSGLSINPDDYSLNTFGEIVVKSITK